MNTWQYRFFIETEDLPLAASKSEEIDVLEEKLNAIGAEGWEIYTQQITKHNTIRDNYDDSTKHLVLQVWAKRPVEKGPYR